MLGTPDAGFSQDVKTMCKKTLAELNPSATVAKRAAYEAFEFGIDAPGLVRVTNGSYGDDAENHSYLVDVEEVQQSIS